MSSTGHQRRGVIDAMRAMCFRAPSLRVHALALALLAAFQLEVSAEVPAVIHYQGRVLAGGNAFAGSGQFKFSLVNADATQTYWRNAADANADGEPDAAVAVSVTRGLYSVLLGDTTLANMGPLPNNLFTNSAVYLRVWFSDGVKGFEQLSPDQRIVAVGYAMIAAGVSDGAVSLQKLAPDARGAIESALDKSTNLNTRADLLQSQIAALTGRLDSLSLTQIAIPPGLTAASTDPADAALLNQGFVAFNTTTPASWVNGASLNAPAARYAHSGVWTGDSFIVWGGNLGGDVLTGSGAIYRPSLDAWESVATFNSPGSRNNHVAVWTGQEMIVWGGFSGGQYLNTGGKFQPATQEWNSTTTTGAPAGRLGHVAVWTGSALFVWGGLNSSGLLNDGALYDPVTDVWTTVALPNPPEARQNAAFTWAGDRLILWGGTGAAGAALNTGAQLVFTDGSHPSEWRAMSAVSAPSGRIDHSLVWTGQKILVWGGKSNNVFQGNGAVYDPVADAWQAITSTQAPSARAAHSAVWTGAEMLILGGDSNSGAVASCGAYDPSAGKWRALNNAGTLQARSGASAAWSGAELIVFGGRSGSQAVGALKRLNPQPAWTFYRKP